MAIVMESDRLVLSKEDARVFNNHIINANGLENKNIKNFKIQVKKSLRVEYVSNNTIRLK